MTVSEMVVVPESPVKLVVSAVLFVGEAVGLAVAVAVAVGPVAVIFLIL